ncbi:histidine kinase [Saccharophagus sp. K07]|jgi:chemotaxis protein CheC|uniref:histidine kinase n=1 Tax=Saccharophagus sp. K07 TaxID=2283636 RepID=UPI0016520355|nr:histidine kinase [Saccharophagus sp. K07]MBC6906379.1 histidine kinase [Saccharophagus sp. K07]
MNTTITLSEDYRDCLQEVTNIAMGQAGDRLARLLDTFVVLSIPHIEILAPSDIAMAINAIDGSASVSGVCQGFIGGGIAGEAILLFNDTSFSDLSRLLKYDGELDHQAERELLMDTANVLLGAFLRGVAVQLDMSFSLGPPLVLGQHQRLDNLFDPKTVTWQQALVTEINYKLEGYNVNCDLLVIFTEEFIDLLCKKLDYLLL